MKTTILYMGVLADRAFRLSYLESVHEALGGYRFGLLGFNMNAEKIDAAFPTISLPKLYNCRIRQSRAILPVPPSMITDAVLETASIESELNDCSFDQVVHEVNGFRQYLLKIIQKTCPAMIIFGHQYTAYYIIAREICEQVGIPFLFDHQGLIPGTMSLEENGHIGESPICVNSEIFQKIPVTDDNLAMATAYLDFQKASRTTRHQQSRNHGVYNKMQHHKAKGLPIVFYAGLIDYKTGILPTWLKHARWHSPYALDTYDALKKIYKVTSKNNWHLLFKPHPHFQRDTDKTEEFDPKKFTAMPSGDLFDCFDVADVVVTLVSTVAYDAMIAEKPVVLMGRMPLSGKEMVYEALQEHDLENQIRLGMTQGFTPTIKENWYTHVARLISESHYGYQKEVIEIIDRGPADAAHAMVLRCKRQPAWIYKYKGNQNADRGRRFLLWYYWLNYILSQPVKAVDLVRRQAKTHFKTEV